jgi:type IV pilus assembly protein PilY1
MNHLNRGIATHSYNHIIFHFLIALSLVFAFPLFAKAECSSSIADYSAIPPFLSGGVEGNLLLMLDNSGSMYDLAYVDVQEYCYDDNYTAANVYAGYFDRDVWYKYDETDGQFEESTATACDSATGTKYSSSEVCITVNPDEVTAFAAKGNLLNWATASKLDIQKKILTGGKYEEAGTYGAPNGRIVMESRGCLDRRFVKQVPVEDSFLTLGIRPPQEETFPPWENGTLYQEGDIVNDVGDLYIADSRGTSGGIGVADDNDKGVVNWLAYTLTRWTNGATYPADSVVSDNGKMYITATGGTASGTGVADDTGITDWVSYNVTHIEIFPVTETGFDHNACELAIEELGKESPIQGLLKGYIEECMGYQSGGGQSEEADSHAAFNHAIQNCWYAAKHNKWQPGGGSVESMKTACEKIYVATDPWELTPWDRGYVCFGVYDDDPDTVPNPNPFGYVGRCWNPGTNATTPICTQWKNPNACTPHVAPDPECCLKWGGTSDNTTAGWDAADVYACVEQALKDYCGMLKVPEVIDPSDQASETSEFWNIPAVLIDSGVIAQIGQPIAVFKGYIKQDEVPTGLIQEFADDLRIGVMIFNDYGSKTECNSTVSDNRDGGKIISYIDQGKTHTSQTGP